MRTVIVAANVVDTFAEIEDHASEKISLTLLTRRRTLRAARRARAGRPRVR